MELESPAKSGLGKSFFNNRKHYPLDGPKSADASHRLAGLDLARFLAFFGMVVVNFSVVMGASPGIDLWANWISTAFEGRAAASFVVLAGVGLGLAAIRSSVTATRLVTYKRALFLMVVGLLNSLVFSGDILHFYAIYFVAGSYCLGLSSKQLLLAIAVLVGGFMALLLVFDYDAGWDWDLLVYSGFWTIEGFARNLLFNGWHPFVPWFSFFLFGIFLARMKLNDPKVWTILFLAGVVSVVAAEVLSTYLMQVMPVVDGQSLGVLFATKPIPPGPIYMLNGMGGAALLIGLCLHIEKLLKGTFLIRVLATTGRQTLTLYLAHIFIGMTVLSALNMLAGQSPAMLRPTVASLVATAIFCCVAVIYANIWSHFFKAGPVELLMRKLAG